MHVLMHQEFIFVYVYSCRRTYGNRTPSSCHVQLQAAGVAFSFSAGARPRFEDVCGHDMQLEAPSKSYRTFVRYVAPRAKKERRDRTQLSFIWALSSLAEELRNPTRCGIISFYQRMLLLVATI